MTLNEFHEAIRARNAEVFANNHHTRETAALAVISEIGELCNAVVGVMGCEERKKHLTNDDVLDGIGDACVYLSVLADKCGVVGLGDSFDAQRARTAPLSTASLVVATSASVARIARRVNEDALRAPEVALAMRHLELLAKAFGCTDFLGLLAKTFNHVSERSGSKIRVTHESK